MKTRLLRYFIGLLTLVLLARCQQVRPKPPVAEAFDPPIAPATSYLAGSITFRIAELEKKINEELDPVLVGKGSKSGKSGSFFPFRVARSGRVHIEYTDQQIKFSTPLQLWITTPFNASSTPPDKPFCSLQVNFKSPLQVTSDWRLASKVSFTDYEWLVKPTIRVLGREIGLTNLAEKVLTEYRSSIESAIDTAIHSELRLDKMVEPVWQSIQKPLLIDKTYGLWLTPVPLRVLSGPISGNAERIATPLQIVLDTRTHLSPTTPAYTERALPALEKLDRVNQLSDLHILSSLPYTDINRLLKKMIGEKPKKMALGLLTIKEASVYGSHHALIVKTEVNGLLDGTIYFRGRPVFDTLMNTLKVENLEFDADSDDVLPRFAGWIVHDSFLKLVSTLLTIPLGDDIAQLPQKIQEAFEKGKAGKKVNLGIKDFSFKPQKIAIRPDGLQTLIHVRSKAVVQLEKL
jgi:hypothetical protein